MSRSLLGATALALGMAWGLASPRAAEASLERGRYLVETIMACGSCHTPQGPDGPVAGLHLAGGMVFDEGVFRAVSANITSDAETGVGGWSDAGLAKAIRECIRPNGQVIGPPMPCELYHGLGDDDLYAIVAYLRTIPPIHNQPEASTYSFPLPPAYGPPVSSQSAPDRADPVAYGGYLAGPIAHCVECHTPMGADGRRDWSRIGAGGSEFKGPWRISVAADLTPSGLGDWSDAEIVTAVTKGMGRDGRQLMPPMGYGFYRGIHPEDLTAIIAYLRQLPPAG
jgi:mono/diheme cytochrome c family protein